MVDKTLHNGTSNLSFWEKRYDKQVLLWSKLLLTVERGAAKLVNLSKLVAIMHARAPVSVLIGGWDDHLVGQLTGCNLVHCCTLSLCYLGAETDRWSLQKPKYQYRDHLVGQLTSCHHACARSVSIGGWDDHLVGQLTGCHHACARAVSVRGGDDLIWGSGDCEGRKPAKCRRKSILSFRLWWELKD